MAKRGGIMIVQDEKNLLKKFTVSNKRYYLEIKNKPQKTQILE